MLDEKSPSTPLRSLHDVILRKHLGDKRVAMHVYQHGLPHLLCEGDAPPRTQRWATAAELPPAGPVAAVADTFHWIEALVTMLSARETDVHLSVLRMLSARVEDLSDEQHQARRARMLRCRELAAQFAKGKRLGKDRDSGKRRVDDMSTAEHQILEDYDCGRLQKRRRQVQTPRGSAFRSPRPWASAAEEHATANLSAWSKAHTW